MKIQHENYDQLTVLTLDGDFVADQVERFQKVADERIAEDIRDFVVDVAKMEFIDSRGLESLLWLQEVSGERLGQVRLANTQENVAKILEITRLASRIDSHPDVDSAIKSLR